MVPAVIKTTTRGEFFGGTLSRSTVPVYVAYFGTRLLGAFSLRRSAERAIDKERKKEMQ